MELYLVAIVARIEKEGNKPFKKTRKRYWKSRMRSYSSGVRIISDFLLRPRFFGCCAANWGFTLPFITPRFIWRCCGPDSDPGGVDVGVERTPWPPAGHVMLSGLPTGLLAVLMPPIDISSSTNEYGSTGVSHLIATYESHSLLAKLIFLFFPFFPCSPCSFRKNQQTITNHADSVRSTSD